MKKHAYLFTVNSNFKVLNACLRLLDEVTNDIYILFDKKAFPTLDDARLVLCDLHKANYKYINIRVINWGGYSQVEAEIELIKQAVSSGVNYSYLHFLQNSDLPIKRHKDIIDFFAKNEGKEFVNIERGSCAWAEQCCKYRYFFCHNRYYRTNKFLKILNIALARLQQFMHIRVNQDVSFFYGSALFSITLSFAKYVVSKEEEIYKHFRWALAPDEKFLQTILMNSSFAQSLAESFSDSTMNGVLIDWQRERQKNSPHVWRKEELSYLLSMPAHYCYARKFMENVDAEIVTLLEEKLTH